MVGDDERLSDWYGGQLKLYYQNLRDNDGRRNQLLRVARNDAKHQLTCYTTKYTDYTALEHEISSDPFQIIWKASITVWVEEVYCNADKIITTNVHLCTVKLEEYIYALLT